ncbi:MAG: cobalamin biosynthesis protein [Deltaproteobacteria bacterium]|nr:cobalamin biosynthesis protein [Deltaproteobacteria bacterium]
MIRVFRTGLETAEIQSDRIFKITNIALIIVSENSLKKAVEIYRGIASNLKDRGQTYNQEIINIHFFIEKAKTALTSRAFSLLEEIVAFETPFAAGTKPVSVDIRGYKKLSEDYFIKGLFCGYDYIIFFLAVGAVVRIIAPFLRDKFNDPGIIAIDEAGKFVVSLLSGHIGGANKFAGDAAGYIGGGAVPVITTATDAAGNFSIDMFAERFGLFIEDGESKIKIFNKASLNSENIDVLIDAADIFNFDIEEIMSYLGGFRNAKKIRLISKLNIKKTAKNTAVISFREDLKGTAKTEKFVFLRPKCLTVGIGCNKNTSFEEIEDFISSVFKENNLSLKSIRNIATIDLKRNEAGLLEFGYKYGGFIDFYDKDEINAFMDSNKKIEPSASFKHTGAYSVCEPCAMMSAKNGGKLLIPKQKKGNVTAAVAVGYSI